MKRYILHIYDQSLPPSETSGGSNRLIDWLAKEQSKQGHKVVTISPSGFSTDYFQHIKFNLQIEPIKKLISLIPSGVTDIEHHGGLNCDQVKQLQLKYPKLIQIVHAGKGEGINRVFVSESHAKQAGEYIFSYNGVPVDEYIFNQIKGDFFLFLAKVKRSKKGVSTAIRIAKITKKKLIIAGGWRLGSPETWFNWHPLIESVGFVNGYKKQNLLSQAKALIVPIKWEEPFGLTIVEAMMSGTPVIAFNRGAMKELIVDCVTGFICENENEMINAMEKVNSLNPIIIRQHALANFSVSRMAQQHLKLLDKSEFETW